MISFATFFAITIIVAFVIVAIAGWLHFSNDGFDMEETNRKALKKAIRNLEPRHD